MIDPSKVDALLEELEDIRFKMRRGQCDDGDEKLHAAVQRWAQGLSQPPSDAHSDTDIQKPTVSPRETVVAQHDETGRMWEGPRDQIPRGYSAVEKAVASWNPYSNDGMRHMENSDVIGGETDETKGSR